MKIRSLYDGERKRVSVLFGSFDKKTGEFVAEKSRTKQADKESCDINLMMQRFGRIKLLRQRTDEPSFGDFSNCPDFMEACEIVAKAENAFNRLGADVRARFGHDPAGFLAFMDDPRNKDEIVRMGLGKALSPVVPQQPPTGGAVTPKDGAKESGNAPVVSA